MEKRQISPSVKTVIMLLGMGAFLAASIIIPGLPLAIKPFLDEYKRKQWEKARREWNRFNQPRLRQLLRRLQEQKIVELIKDGDGPCIKLTQKGETKLLKYKLEEIMITKPPKWDKKWRLIIYDIRKEKRVLSEIFRNFLRKMEFLKLQKSVYLTPYPCSEQIEFLRQYYGLGEEVLYLEVNKLENEEIYKNYFGL